MAQFVDGGFDTCNNEVRATQFDLKAHLSNYKVPDTVYKLLCNDSITVDELITCTAKDLEDWCNENQLRMIERRRFLNAAKCLPNVQANKSHVPKIIPVFLGNEEKEQLNKFDEMENNVETVIDCVKQIKDLTKVDKVIHEINNICDEIETFVAVLRENLLQQVYI